MKPNKRTRKITITIEEESNDDATSARRTIEITGGFPNYELVGIFEVYKTQYGIAALRESEVKPDGTDNQQH